MTELDHEMPTEQAPIAPKGAQEIFWGLGGFAFVAMILCLGVYRVFGAQLTAGLDEACAEGAFDAGQKLEASGNLAPAVQKYRQAMEGQFASEDLRTQCGLLSATCSSGRTASGRRWPTADVFVFGSGILRAWAKGIVM